MIDPVETADSWRFLASSAIGVVVGSFLTLCLNWMKANREDGKARCDEFIALVGTAANTATNFRLKTDNNPDTQAEYCRLLGYQQRLSLARKELFPPFDSLHRELLDAELTRFFGACTGGDASEPVRNVDIVRAREAQGCAASIASLVRIAHSDSVKLTSIAMRKLGLR